jgi:hypothetical protein
MIPWLLLGAATALGLLWMLALHLIHLRAGDTGIGDFGWSGGLRIAAFASNMRR